MFIISTNLFKILLMYLSRCSVLQVGSCCIIHFPSRLLARILKMGVQILSGPKAHLTWRRRRHVSRGVWGHGPPENFEKLKHLRRDVRDSEQL